jgi:hypothetical protein
MHRNWLVAILGLVVFGIYGISMHPATKSESPQSRFLRGNRPFASVSLNDGNPVDLYHFDEPLNEDFKRAKTCLLPQAFGETKHPRLVFLSLTSATLVVKEGKWGYYGDGRFENFEPERKLGSSKITTVAIIETNRKC